DKVWDGRLKFREFMIGRFARIYPLHILTVLLSIPLIADAVMAKPVQYGAVFVLHLFLLHSLVPIEPVYFNFNTPSWSISDEWFFYMLTPVLLLLLGRFSRKWSIVGIAAVLALFIFTMMRVTDATWAHALFYINPVFRLFDFALGILLFLFWRTTKDFAWSDSSSTILQVAALCIFTLSFIGHDRIGQVYRYSIYYWPSMVLIIYAFSLDRGLFARQLENKILVYLGEISFGFYLYHQLIFRYFFAAKRNFGIAISDTATIAILFASTLIVSMISFRYFEKPMNRILKLRFSKKTTV
ncbi:MAG: acyltransferase, partial [Proteobacteria bacterium]